MTIRQREPIGEPAIVLREFVDQSTDAVGYRTLQEWYFRDDCSAHGMLHSAWAEMAVAPCERQQIEAS